MRSFTVSFLTALVALVQLKEHAASSIGHSDAAMPKLVDMFVDRFLDRVLTSFPAARTSEGLPVDIDDTTLRIAHNWGIMPRGKGRWERARRNYYTAPENGWENCSIAELTEMFSDPQVTGKPRDMGWRSLRSLPEYPGGPYVSVHKPISQEEYIKQRSDLLEKGGPMMFRGTSWNGMGLMGPKWPKAPPEEKKKETKERTKAVKHQKITFSGVGGTVKPKWMLKEEEAARLQEIEDKKKADAEYAKELEEAKQAREAKREEDLRRMGKLP